MKFKLKNLIYKNSAQIRYISSGIFFTLVGPTFFIFLASYIPPKIAILITDLLIHSLRFNVLTRWVFRSKVNKSSVFAYLKATIPLSFCNFVLVSLLVPILGNIIVAILVGFFSATIGFIWNKICYKNTLKF